MPISAPMATRFLMLALLCTSQAAASRWQRIVKGASSLPSQPVLADGSPLPGGATPPQPRPMMGADSPALHTDRQLHIQVAAEHLDTSSTVPSANSTSQPHSFSDKQQEQSHVAERHRNSHKATVNATVEPAGTQPQQQAPALVSRERPASLALNVKGPHSPQVAQLLSRARQDLAHFKNGISQAMVEQVGVYASPFLAPVPCIRDGLYSGMAQWFNPSSLPCAGLLYWQLSGLSSSDHQQSVVCGEWTCIKQLRLQLAGHCAVLTPCCELLDLVMLLAVCALLITTARHTWRRLHACR